MNTQVGVFEQITTLKQHSSRMMPSEFLIARHNGVLYKSMHTQHDTQHAYTTCIHNMTHNMIRNMIHNMTHNMIRNMIRNMIHNIIRNMTRTHARTHTYTHTTDPCVRVRGVALQPRCPLP